MHRAEIAEPETSARHGHDAPRANQPAGRGAAPLVSPEYAFDRIIAPVPVEEFLSDYYEKRVLVTDREQPDYYADLLSVETLDDFLAANWPFQPQVFAVDANREISPEEYVQADNRIDMVRLHQLFDEGATITFRQMHNRLPELGQLCRAAEQMFNGPFQTNLYFTPAGAQGFKTHHDTHDVFVLQVSGAKMWRVYDPVVPLPLPGQNFDDVKDRLGPVTEEFLLNAGDLFYCPRGVPHDANATDEPSLHITFGALVNTWAEVMLEALAAVCLEDPAFRKSLPVGYATGGAAPAELERIFRDLVDRFSRSSNLAPALDGIAEKFVGDCRAMLPGQRRQLAALDTLSLDSLVGARPGLIYRCGQEGDVIHLHCHTTELSFPQSVEEALRHALETQNFRLRDLPGRLDDEGRLVLIRRLIREGLVMQIS